MTSASVHRFHNVANEERWVALFNAWRTHLDGLWNHLAREEAPWAWGERTNVGLLASAHERTPEAWSMVELPIRRGDGAEDPGRAGRMDLWLGAKGWSVHAEAKQVWAPSWGGERIEYTVGALEHARAQAGDLKRKGWTQTVASLAFVVPYTSWTRRTTASQLETKFVEFEDALWKRHDKRTPTFQTHFLLPADQFPRFDGKGVRKRTFPGVILAGRIHKVTKA